MVLQLPMVVLQQGLLPLILLCTTAAAAAAMFTAARVAAVPVAQPLQGAAVPCRLLLLLVVLRQVWLEVLQVVLQVQRCCQRRSLLQVQHLRHLPAVLVQDGVLHAAAGCQLLLIVALWLCSCC